MKDGIEHVVHSCLRSKLWLCAFLEDSSADQDGIPCVLCLLVELVGAANVRFGGVTDKINCIRWRVDAMGVLSPLLQKTSGKLERADLWLAESRRVQLHARDGLVHGFQREAERTHAKSGEVVGSRPHDIVVREEHWRAFIESRRPGTKHATLGHEQVQNNLLVAGPISAVGKDENSLDLGFGKVSLPRILLFVLGERAKRRGVRVVFDDVARSHNILEAVALGDIPAFLAFAADNKNSVVFRCHLPHWCVATDELTGGNLDIKLFAQLDAALLLGLAAAVGDENVWTVRTLAIEPRATTRFATNVHLNSIGILAIEDLHGFNGFRDRVSTADEDAVYVEGESVLVGDHGLWRGLLAGQRA